MTDYLAEFANAVNSGPSYAQTYPTVRNNGRASSPVSPNISSALSPYSNYTALRTSPNIDYSNLANVQAIFDATNTAQNYANVYAGVGKPESIAKSQQELANEAVVNSTPFGFANALFEGQLTPQLSNKIVSKQPNPSLFALQTADFLNPRIGSPAQGTEIKSEITPVTPSSVGSAFAGAIASSPGSAPFDNSGILPSPSAGSQMPGQSGSFNDPSNPSNSGTSQNPQNNPPLLGGGGAGDNGSSPGGSSSGILSQLEDFVSKHPIIVAAIIIGTVILVTGGKRR